MTSTGPEPVAADRSSRFPAPGSSVPGAPPPLARALTPADGTGADYRDAPAPTADHAAASASFGDAAERRDASGFLAAAAMAGVAIGLELARFTARRRRG